MAIRINRDNDGGVEFAKSEKMRFGIYTWGNFNRCIFWLEQILGFFYKKSKSETLNLVILLHSRLARMFFYVFYVKTYDDFIKSMNEVC